MSSNQTCPLVSIVMPIYSSERFLSEAIESVLSQTYTNWELLLLNDESPGNAREISLQFTERRIRYFEHSNSGPSATRNRGIRESRGEYIAFLDSDDTWNSFKLEKQIGLLEQRPEVGVIYSQKNNMNEYGKVVPDCPAKFFEGMILNQLWVDNFVCMSSAVIRRTVIEQIGYLDETLRMSEDFDYWLRVACKIPFAFVNEPLVNYRIHNTQVSKQTELRMQIVREIRNRFDLKHGAQLSLKARCIANSSILSNKAARNSGKCPLRITLADYLKSLCWYPFRGAAWRGLASVLLPQFFISFYRKYRHIGKR